jgi:hypothetical protein
MEFFEKDLEEIIFLSDKEELSERGLFIEGNLKRQLRIGHYGIADLVETKRPRVLTGGGFKKGLITVYELKNNKIGVSTFFQALNYLKGIQSYIRLRGFEGFFNYKIILIGRHFDRDSSFCYLPEIFPKPEIHYESCYDNRTYVELYTYSYSLLGINFKEVRDYDLIDNGFKIK